MVREASPLVGIAPLRVSDAGGGRLVTVRTAYVQAVVAAGGVPVLLPAVDSRLAGPFVTGVDAVVLPGGRDIPPAFYGDKPEPDLEEVLEDDLAETYLEIARIALEEHVPLLGICLGFQVMNVALGGTLVQHLRPAREGSAERVLHRGPGQVDVRHDVSVKPGSALAEAIGRDGFPVLSHHHQGLGQLGAGLEPVAWAADGVIEAVEHLRHRFFVGVQWHPERAAGEEATEKLFAALVSEARLTALNRMSRRP